MQQNIVVKHDRREYYVMLFNSLHFLIFLPIVTIAYFALPHRYRWIWLLVSSYYFYMCWEARYALLMGLSTLITYGTAWGMHYSKGSLKRFYLIFSLATNLSILFFFKYYNFFTESMDKLFESMGLDVVIPAIHVLLPVGISFYTFQALSYSIDSYRGRIDLERHLGIYALYVSFFPQLVAGPIERSTNLIHQLRQHHIIDYQRLRSGLLIMGWGFFKKVVVADRAAVLVNRIYNSPEEFSGPFYIVATLLFSAQIYCDFSGYTDIAIGAARIMGIDLMTNFRMPYFSKSIGEFWNRWHISLSTWFRDYLYIPLGGSRCSKQRVYVNILVVFIVSGLWHGASWNFVIWGALNGLYLLAEIIFNMKSRTHERVSWTVNLRRMAWTFALTNLAWIFFRANTVHDAFYVLRHLPEGFAPLVANLTNGAYLRGLIGQLGVARNDLYVLVGAIGALWLVDSLLNSENWKTAFYKRPAWVRWTVYYALVLSILGFGEFNTSQQFIYFQF